MQSLDVQFAGRPRTVFVCEDLEDVVEYTDWVRFRTTNGYAVFGLDVESTGLDPWSEDFRVTLVQISDGQRTYVVPTHVTGAHEALIGTLENPKVKVATHSQYDAVALATLGIVLGPKVIDTYVLSRLLAPGNGTPHGLTETD
jgi:DNA polymerase-1